MNRAATLLIHSAESVSGGVVTPDGWMAAEGGVIAAVGSGDGWRSWAGENTEVIDAAGRFLTPGFIDIHCHGGGGAAFDDGADGIRTALALHRAHGTTRSVVSLVTAPLADLEARLRVVAALAAEDPLVLGSHLEGPFLDATHKGAHPAELLVPPTPDAIERLLEAAARNAAAGHDRAGGRRRDGCASPGSSRPASPSPSGTPRRPTSRRARRSTRARAS